MAFYFLDTSAVVKRYIQEPGTAWLQVITSPDSGHAFFVARITLVETISAMTRRERGGSFSPMDAAKAWADLQHDFAWQYSIVEIKAGLLDRAAILARIHALRGYDAVQLAAALEIHSLVPNLILLSADRELNTVANREGLRVIDPNTYVV
jgi:predicted nucleic acid-binding protein